jgi:hypothetical protein
MAYADRVKDTSTTTGTGNLTLSGTAPTGYQSFNTAFGTGVYFPYTIAAGSEWEVGEGHLSASTTLVRDTVWASSNSGSAVSFSAGTKDVFCTVAATKLPITAYLKSDVTYNNSTTLTNLTDLSISVVAGGIYAVSGLLVGTRSGATNTSHDFNGGSATVTNFYATLQNPGGGNSATALSTNIVSPFLGSSFSLLCFGMLYVNAAGTFIPRAAQYSAHASDTVFKVGSYLSLTKLN